MREQFARRYGDWEGLYLDFVVLGHTRAPDGLPNLRLQMTYRYDEATGPKLFEKERRIKLRETQSGLRYPGTWD